MQQNEKLYYMQRVQRGFVILTDHSAFNADARNDAVEDEFEAQEDHDVTRVLIDTADKYKKYLSESGWDSTACAYNRGHDEVTVVMAFRHTLDAVAEDARVKRGVLCGDLVDEMSDANGAIALKDCIVLYPFHTEEGAPRAMVWVAGKQVSCPVSLLRVTSPHLKVGARVKFRGPYGEQCLGELVELERGFGTVAYHYEGVDATLSQIVRLENLELVQGVGVSTVIQTSYSDGK